jgi:hypothetical protein
VPVSTSPLASPDYLTFGKTDPGTLAYPDEEEPTPKKLTN